MKTTESKDRFTEVVIIYNPNSTGSGKDMALELRRKLPGYDVKLVKTKYAGHAEYLAYTHAKATAKPLIISASGDGGYHEVVNGLMRAQKTGARPTAGLLPAGNANDHYHDAHGVNLADAITSHTVQQVDLLKIRTQVGHKTFERYAHSYIGFGLTPKVGNELNKVTLHWFNEIAIIIRALFVLQPVKILNQGMPRTYDSLIFSNISKMSKVIALSKSANYDDGKFEVTIFKRRNKLRLIKLLLKASTTGLVGADKYNTYDFKTIKETLVQIDGEISTIDADSEVRISIDRRILNCIV